MMRTVSALSLLLGVHAGLQSGQDSQAVSPVQKVIELLEDNRLKVLNDLKAEEKEMTEFTGYCDEQTKDKTYSIQTATRKIAELEASVEDTEAQIAGLADEITSLGTELSSKDRDLAAATEVRKKENADFSASEKELVESVDQLERAIVMIKRGTAFVQGASATQVDPQKAMNAALKVFAEIADGNRVNVGLRRKLQGLLQTTADASNGDDSYQKLGQPQAKVENYESSSGGILGELTSMKEKAEETLSDVRMAEMRQQHNFDTFSQGLVDAIKIAKEKLADAKKSKAEMGEAQGKSNGELVEAQKTKEADETFLAALGSDCKNAAASWEERQESARGELGAISKAKEILSEGVRVFMQVGHKSAGKGDIDTDADFAAEETSPQDMKRQNLVQKLKKLSSKFGSYALMELAGTAATDPFEKVKGLIQDMITKLVRESNEQATQKAFCDEETSKSRKAQEEKSMTIDKLSSRMDKASATKALLEQSVKDLQSEIAALDKGTAESTKVRADEHKVYLKSTKDFKDAADAVERAIKVLKEYYDAALIQTSARHASSSKQPEFGEAKSDASHAIISILEMCGEDFTKMLMEAETEEAEAQKAFEELTQDNKVSKVTKEAEIKGAESEVKSLTVAIQSHKEDYDLTSKELDSVMTYLDKLKPQCEAKAMSYGEKKARREAEINGLKEALEILQGPALVQAKAQRRLLRAHA